MKRVVFADFVVAKDMEAPHAGSLPTALEATRDELDGLDTLRSMVLTIRRSEGDHPHAKLSRR